MKFLITRPKDDLVFRTFFTENVLAELKKHGEISYNTMDREFTKEELLDINKKLNRIPVKKKK